VTKSSNGSWPALGREFILVIRFCPESNGFSNGARPGLNEGWPTTIAAFHHNPIPCYGLGWCFYRDEVDTYLHPTRDWWSPHEFKYAVFTNDRAKYGYREK